MTELVHTERHDHILVVSMRREAKRNAIDRAMADAIDDALNRLDDDHDLWVGILAGTPSVFSAGSDLRADGDYITERGGEYGLIRRDRRKPLIAAVEGPALGGGLEMILCCDLVVASRTARFGLPEVAIGALPSCGALFRAPHALPLNLARELILTGEPIDVDRAHGRLRQPRHRPGQGACGSAGPRRAHLQERAALGAGLPRGRERDGPAARRGGLGGNHARRPQAARHPRHGRGDPRLPREAPADLDRPVAELSVPRPDAARTGTHAGPGPRHGAAPHRSPGRES